MIAAIIQKLSVSYSEKGEWSSMLRVLLIPSWLMRISANILNIWRTSIMLLKMFYCLNDMIETSLGVRYGIHVKVQQWTSSNHHWCEIYEGVRWCKTLQISSVSCGRLSVLKLVRILVATSLPFSNTHRFFVVRRILLALSIWSYFQLFRKLGIAILNPIWFNVLKISRS